MLRTPAASCVAPDVARPFVPSAVENTLDCLRLMVVGLCAPEEGVGERESSREPSDGADDGADAGE
jgi:hypothetical protein